MTHIKAIFGFLITAVSGGLHWLVDLTPELIVLSTLVSVIVGLLTACYIVKKIVSKPNN